MPEYLGVDTTGVLRRAADLSDLTAKPLALDSTGRLLPVTGESQAQAQCYLTVDGSGRLLLVDPPIEMEVVQVSAGGAHSLFLTNNGIVYSCGSNAYGQLAREVDDGSPTSVNLGVIAGLPKINYIFAGANNSAFIDLDGNVYNCGYNEYGQLGRAVTTGSQTKVNLGLVTGLPEIAQVAGEAFHTLFVSFIGNVYSCGYNNYGELGRTVLTGSEANVNLGYIDGLHNVTHVAAGSSHSLFLTSSGQVYSSGGNRNGELGRVGDDGSESSVNIGEITGLPTISQIAAGANHSLFLTSNGQVYTSGSNSRGQLGRVVNGGSRTDSNLGAIADLTNVQQIAAGSSQSLFLASSGQVYSCGNNALGQLGRAVSTGSRTTSNLGPILGLPDIIQAKISYDQSLLFTSSGRVFSCGKNTAGQLGRIGESGSQTVVNLGEIYF